MGSDRFPKYSRWKYAPDVLIVLPVYLFVINVVFNASGQIPYFRISQEMYLISLLFSVFAFLISRNLKDKLYVKGEIPADTSMFIGVLIMFPFILSLPTGGMAINAFLILDGAIIVASAVFAVVGTTLRPKDFPVRDSLTVFFAVTMTVAISAVLSILLFAFNNFITLGFLFGYLSVFYLIQLAIYTVQLFGYRDKFNLMKAF
jgi:hypothetical protein